MKRIVHVTRCERCNLQWANPEDRDYSGDRCQNCNSTVKYMGKQEIDVKQGVLPRSRYAHEFPETLEG